MDSRMQAQVFDILNAMKLEVAHEDISRERVFSQERQRIKEWFDHFCQSGKLSEDSDDWRFWRDVPHLAGSTRKLHRLHSEAFLSELISFFEDNENTDEDRLELFAQQLKENLFSSTAHPGEGIPTATEFMLMVRAARVPTLQAGIASTLGGDVVYDLSSDETGHVVESIHEAIRSAPIADRVDALEQLVTVASRATGWGEWAEAGSEHVRSIVEEVSRTTSVPLVHYAAEAVLRNIQHEEQAPQIGAIEWTGNRASGRVSQETSAQVKETTKHVFNHVFPDVRFNQGALLPVAKNRIGLFDHSMLPQRIANVSLDALAETKDPPISGGALANLRYDLQHLKDSGYVSLRAMQSLLGVVSNKLAHIIAPSGDELSSDLLATWWASVSKALSSDEWYTFWNINDEIETASEDEYRTLQKNFRDFIAKLCDSDLFIQDVSVAVEAAIQDNKELWTPAHFATYREELRDKIIPVSVATDGEPDLLLRMLHKPDLRTFLEETFNFNYLDFTEREQYYLLSFLIHSDIGQSNAASMFSREFGVDGLRTFLAAHVDSAVGSKILEFAHTAPKEKVKETFKAFGQFADRVEDLEQYLLSEFGIEDSAIAYALTEKVIQRGHALLSKAHTFAEEPEKLQTLLENLNVGIDIFVNTCRLLKKAGSLNLEEIKGGSFESTLGSELSEEDRKTILAIQQERYKGKYAEELDIELRTALANATTSEHSRFYIFRKDGDIVAYVRFDSDADESGAFKHAASLMTNPTFEGGALGQALFETSLLEERKESIEIRGECDPSLLPMYQKLGFEFVREYNDHGAATYDIRIPVHQAETEPSALAA